MDGGSIAHPRSAGTSKDCLITFSTDKTATQTANMIRSFREKGQTTEMDVIVFSSDVRDDGAIHVGSQGLTAISFAHLLAAKRIGR